MGRNEEIRFSELPKIEMSRSKFKRQNQHKTTFNTGDLIPIYVDEVLPGDTVNMKMGSIIRMSTPIYPVMDNANVDFYFFFTPARLLWEHWREFWGENRLTAWEQTVEYSVPQLTAPEGGWKAGTIADYMGIPTLTEGISVNALPFRAYAMIWNEWFRSEALKDPAMVNIDDATQTGSNDGDYVANAQLGAKPLKVAKYHDYFTSALPEAQKGPEVSIPLGTKAPVTTRSEIIPTSKFTGAFMKLYDDSAQTVVNRNLASDSSGTCVGIGTSPSGTGVAAIPANLWADLSLATAATINELREAFAVQRFYEAQSRGGTRYREFLKNIFGVTSPDARMQVPEYLGGFRQRINIDQVLQTSSTDAVSPQGNTAAFSCTTSGGDLFTYSATEHGYLMGLAVIRTDHTYQQGLDRMWNRKKWTDFYVPQFANLGEQAILNKEIYATGTDADDEAFGYQEYAASYRYKPSRVSGMMRSNYTGGTLDSWHYADYYTTQPTLSSEWIDEVTTNVDRTLAVQSSVSDQFIADFYFDGTWVRPMPVYSVPGLLDHH